MTVADFQGRSPLTSVLDAISHTVVPSVLWHCRLGGRKGIWPVKKWGDGGGGHWIVRMEWCPAGWSMCLPLLIFLCTIKSRSSLLALSHQGGPDWLEFNVPFQHRYGYMRDDRVVQEKGQ